MNFTAIGGREGPLGALYDVIAVCDTAVILYFVALNTGHLVLNLLALGEIARRMRREPFAGHEDAAVSPFTPPVSVIMPAYNEAAGITEAVRAMLLLHYPVFEVIVVDDGSTDGTLDALAEAFDLAEVDHAVPEDVPMRGPVVSLHLPRGGPVPLVVARKENGGKADALNVGINLARYPLLCMVDADSILDSQALLAVAKPFSDDPLRVIATGGVVGIANGCTVEAGRVVEAHVPTDLLGRVQVVEYLRGFFLGRTGWSRVGGLLIIAGAFGLFRRDAVVAVGGMDPDCIGEDAELVVRLHRHMRERGRGNRDYRIVFVTEPISWSEAPSELRVLGRQRRRWQRGLAEILLKHRRMIGNPRYGRVGTIAIPFYVIFELAAPLVELAGLVLVPLGVLLGAVDVAFLGRFLLAAYVYAMIVSLVSVAVEEYAYHRFSRWRDVWGAFVGVVVENVGYRQFTAWWRLRGMWDVLNRAPQVWGSMARSGFGSEQIRKGGERA
ncbi:glycosyltransferase family 2 protein [Streptomyces neyagawaensis]|uniref:glycosyltransferase family 2 protein n=1 Tax=Streptomyces neyagawaensis TaxID=42238 RepID=UPI000B19991B|nr:glycosyltransferase [Streptomyces neyagawaensis]MCL6733654.1 glycosyltransferase family 2 protein [Streptomyces neyagawaensis]MDE1683883.1 glycosyltransferase [Streptomyces neyagawaensis]